MSVPDERAAALTGFAERLALLTEEIGRVIVGQRELVEGALVSLLSRGHSLVIGVPGLAKTLLVKTMAEALGLTFRRVQFTPDLMPSDITGTEILEEDPETGAKRFRFSRGPIFTNLLLADEINRTPPKTQAALLEAMQELRVTSAGTSYEIEPPFVVLATQNPIEQEGTYPLPEAQLDRFMFSLYVPYPSEEEEREIVDRTTGDRLGSARVALSREEIIALQRAVTEVPAPEHVVRYAVRLARATRPAFSDLPIVKSYVYYGAGPRSGIYMVLGAKALALVRGKIVPSSAEVRAVAPSVLRHRVLVNFHAEAEGVTAEEVVKGVLDAVRVDE